MKVLANAVVNWCSYIGAFLYSLHVPSGFGGGVEFDVNKSHIFPWCVLAAITLVGDGPGY